ncbi:hypothetical protein NG799_27105 [Laspinema sp. D1]|uniref:Uncharacterized protein n=1 Tax=Laspinema palackyanum D2a TaxID=2953684 RepID=A0ABT2MYZ6_9CYAN|nr:hypothetical protein [Laspinema sp. D2a]
MRSPPDNCHLRHLSDKPTETRQAIALPKLPALTVTCDRPQLHSVPLNSSAAYETI